MFALDSMCFPGKASSEDTVSRNKKLRKRYNLNYNLFVIPVPKARESPAQGKSKRNVGVFFEVTFSTSFVCPIQACNTSSSSFVKKIEMQGRDTCSQMQWPRECTFSYQAAIRLSKFGNCGGLGRWKICWGSWPEVEKMAVKHPVIIQDGGIENLVY